MTNYSGSRTWKTARQLLNNYSKAAANQLEREAKQNRPWTDQTGNARNSIQCNHQWDGYDLDLILSGNVDYFKYLELGHDLNYSILKPTIDKNAQEIFNGYSRILK